MRPQFLTMSAFGPYAGKVDIDFDKLGTSGLYLITGDTGAGKTTIFDGISYALFGKASGANRDPNMFRSKYADINTPTEVKLTFEYGGKQYTVVRNPEYERPSKRGNGVTREKANAELHYPDGRVVTKARDVDSAIIDLLGIDCNQFSQIAMIAQGDFLKLLLAPTEDRKKIFRQLFRTERFQDLQDRLKAESGRLSREYDQAQSSVKQYINGVECEEDDVLSIELSKAKNGEITLDDTFSLIEKLVEQDKGVDKALALEIARVEADIEKNTQSITKAESYNKIEKDYNISKEQLTEAVPKLDILRAELEKESGKQLEREMVDKSIVLMDTELSKYDELELKKSHFNTVEKALLDISKKLTDKQVQHEKVEKTIEELKCEKITLENAGEQRAKLEAELAQEKIKVENLDDVFEDFNELDKLREKVKKLFEKYSKSIDVATRANKEWSIANRLYLDEQAGLLAKNLVEGEPCPVCGSTEHPVVAVLPENAPDKEALEALKEASDKAQKEAEESSMRAGTMMGSQKTKEEEIEKKVAEILEKEISDIEEPFSKNMENKLSELLTETRKKVKHITNLISAEDVKVKRKKQIEEDWPLQEELEKSITKEITKLKEELASCEGEKASVDKLIIQMQSQLKYKSKADAEAALADLIRTKKKLKRDLEKATEDFNKCDKVIIELKAKLKQLETQLKGEEKSDLEALNLKKNNLLEQKSDIVKKQRIINARFVNNAAALDNIRAKSDEVTAIETKWSWVKLLSNTANGNISGKEKIMLETYIQMTYFDRIIEKANRRLLIMSDNQYELKRRKEAENNRSQSGLELDVMDHYNGTLRSVKTLSGGESFKASLSLALGMSDEIQSSAGGIRLDTMFVDEGFGSLDEESLSQAMKALADLTEGNRIVGIISHVTELKEKIDKQIVVKKDHSNGSKVTLVY